MSKNINLFLKEGAEGLKQKKRLKRFRLIAVGSLLLVLLVSLSIYLLINFIFGTSSIERDKEALSAKLLPLREREAKLKVVNDRLSNISLVQRERTDVYRIVDSFLAEIPGGMSIESFEFTEGLVDIQVSSDSLTVVEVFINNLIAMGESKELVGTLILNSLNVGEAGKYEISLKIGLI